MNQTTSWTKHAFVALTLVVALSLSGLVALVVLAGPLEATPARHAPNTQTLNANPELRLMNRFSTDIPGENEKPPSCAALGGVCFPILDWGEQAAT